MLKSAVNLPDDYEYAIVCAPNQSNGYPQGEAAAGRTEFPELRLGFAGMDLTFAALTGVAAGLPETLVVTAIDVPPTADGQWIGAEVRIGRPDSPLVGYGLVINDYLDAGTLKFDVLWTKAAAASGSPRNAYLVYRDRRHSSYPNVRVLTPYLPDQGGAYDPAAPPLIPGLARPSAGTPLEDVAAFLPFSFLEGVFGYGVSEATALASSAGPSTLVLASAVLTAGVLAGGYVHVRHIGGISWSNITDNTTDTLSGLTWEGDGTPSGTASLWKFEAWIPHYFDNPHSFLPGPNFRYPSHLAGAPRGPVYNKPRGNTNWSWLETRFGVWLPFAFALANALGRRVNLIPLAIPASSLMITNSLFGSAVPHGWFGSSVRCDWHPSTPNGLAQRVKRLINMAATANAADGNTKPLRIIGVCGFQGESEAVSAFGRANYKNLLPGFHAWLRSVIHSAGLNLFPRPENIPVVHARIAHSPWEITTIYGPGDLEGEVNEAIDNFAAKVEFVGTINTDDSPQKTGEEIHFDGTGEAINGKLAATEMASLIDAATSGVDTDFSHPLIAEICNNALSMIGAKALLTNLQTDQSEEGIRCRRFFPTARRLLLQRCAWSFATRRKLLEPISEVGNSQWACAYGYPDNAVRIFSVLTETAGDDVSIGLSSGSVVRDVATGLYNSDEQVTAYTPQKFTVEQDGNGYRVVYTNVSNALARYNVMVTDVTQYSPQFMQAMSLQIASMLAGVTMRGEDGTATAQALLNAMERNLGEAMKQDAVQGDRRPQQVVSWMAARRGRR